MKQLHHTLAILVFLAGLAGCNGDDALNGHDHDGESGHDAAIETGAAKGAHGGRLLADEDFVVELAIFETGVPPEYRAWVTNAGTPVTLQEVDLQVTLTRLGGVKDSIGFRVQDDFLRGDTVIYEPHSFVVNVEADWRGEMHRWEYDSFEGRTRIGPEVASAFGLETEVAGPATIRETVHVYGRLVPDPRQKQTVSARFDGVVRTVDVAEGNFVRRGQSLAIVESNQSLKPFTVTASIDGVVTERNVNPGEQTDGRPLFTIMNTSKVWAELAIFPADRERVQSGAEVVLTTADGTYSRAATISRLGVTAADNQSVTAWAELDNADARFLPGTVVSGNILVAEHAVPAAVKLTGLQGFRDSTVVFAQIGDEYEVRMLELGRRDDEWVEVLDGLPEGTRYVTTNSYLVKADIEKSGASHDH